MMIMIRESYRSESGMQHTPEDSFPGTNKNAAESPRFDVAHLFTSPHENIPLLREVAIGHRDAETRWKCVCALAALPADAADVLAFILRESSDPISAPVPTAHSGPLPSFWRPGQNPQIAANRRDVEPG